MSSRNSYCILADIYAHSARAGFNGNDTATQRAIVQFMTDNAVALGKEGWGGYFLPKTRVTFNNPSLDAAGANASDLIASFKALVLTLPGGTFETADEESYLAFYNRWVVQEALSAVSHFQGSVHM